MEAIYQVFLIIGKVAWIQSISERGIDVTHTCKLVQVEVKGFLFIQISDVEGGYLLGRGRWDDRYTFCVYYR